MNHEAFEQLVSGWLDDPKDADLRARIDAATGVDPSLAAVLAEWERFNGLLRRGMPEPRGVDWDRLKARIVTGVADEAGAGGANGTLDAALGQLPGVNERVDWPRFRARVAHALARDKAAPRRRQWRPRWKVAAAAGLAAAAAVLLAVLPVGGPGPEAGGLVRVTIGSPPGAAAGVATDVAEVRMAVAGPTSPPPQCLFLIDPLVPSKPSEEAAGYF